MCSVVASSARSFLVRAPHQQRRVLLSSKGLSPHSTLTALFAQNHRNSSNQDSGTLNSFNRVANGQTLRRKSTSHSFTIQGPQNSSRIGTLGSNSHLFNHNKIQRCFDAQIRWKSTLGVDLDSLGFIPEPPPIPPQSSLTLENLAAAIEGTPGLGMSMWPPSNWMGYGLDWMHTFGLEWWAVIGAAALILRCCTFPVMVMAKRSTALAAKYQPALDKAYAEVKDAQATNDQLRLQMAQMDVSDITKRMKISRRMIPMAVQGLVFVTFFSSVRCLASGPIAGFETGGALWFPNLAIPDPTWALSLTCAGLLSLAIETGMDTGMTPNSPGSKYMKYGLRLVPLISIYFVSINCSALGMYWCISNACGLVMTLILQNSHLQKFLKIPVTEKKAPIWVRMKRIPEQMYGLGKYIGTNLTPWSVLQKFGDLKTRLGKWNKDRRDRRAPSHDSLKYDTESFLQAAHKPVIGTLMSTDPLSLEEKQDKTPPPNKKVVKSVRQLEQEMRLKQRRKQMRQW